MDDQPLYSLTKMTGTEASSARTTVVGSVEFPWRVFVILILAFLVGLFPTAFLFALIGPWSLGFLPLWMASAVWLFHGRTRKGMEIRNYVALINRQRAILNQFMLGPAIVEVPHDDWRIIRRGSTDNPALAVLPEDIPAAAKASEPASTVQAIFG